MERMQFKRVDADGKVTLCEVMATYHHSDNKDYIVFTDHTFDENKKLRIYSTLYEMEDQKIKLIEPSTNAEKKTCLELVKTLIEDIQ